MDHIETGRHWNNIADLWTELARGGYDFYRDGLNTPAFLEMLPVVRGLRGLDVGCGEGHNTRLLSAQGALMTAIDISSVFIQHAATYETDRYPIDYAVASGLELPFGNAAFDFVTGIMSFMDIPETSWLVQEAARMIKPGGFLQFSITHPCYDTPHRKKLCHTDGTAYAYEIGDYFHNIHGEMLTIGAPNSQAAKDGIPPFEIPRFTLTLSQWINAVLDTGLTIEKMNEPRPSEKEVEDEPRLQDAQVVAYFLHIRARKPDAG